MHFISIGGKNGNAKVIKSLIPQSQEEANIIYNLACNGAEVEDIEIILDEFRKNSPDFRKF